MRSYVRLFFFWLSVIGAGFHICADKMYYLQNTGREMELIYQGILNWNKMYAGEGLMMLGLFSFGFLWTLSRGKLWKKSWLGQYVVVPYFKLIFTTAFFAFCSTFLYAHCGWGWETVQDLGAYLREYTYGGWLWLIPIAIYLCVPDTRKGKRRKRGGSKKRFGASKKKKKKKTKKYSNPNRQTP